jgi:hypothetical protein
MESVLWRRIPFDFPVILAWPLVLIAFPTFGVLVGVDRPEVFGECIDDLEDDEDAERLGRVLVPFPGSFPFTIPLPFTPPWLTFSFPFLDGPGGGTLTSLSVLGGDKRKTKNVLANFRFLSSPSSFVSTSFSTNSCACTKASPAKVGALVLPVVLCRIGEM